MAGGTSTKNPNQAFFTSSKESSRLVVFVEPGIGVIQSYAGKCGDSLVAAYGGNDAAEIEDECFYHDRAVSRKTLQR